MATEFPWEQIEKAYVEDGMDVPQIAAQFGVPRLLLGQKVATGGWRKKREAWITRNAAEQLGLDGHELTADGLVGLGRMIGQKLAEAVNQDDAAKVKSLRSQAEAYRTLVEAVDRAVRLGRDVRGIRLGAPSKAQDAEKTVVEYEVVIAETPVGTQQATG